MDGRIVSRPTCAARIGLVAALVVVIAVASGTWLSFGVAQAAGRPSSTVLVAGGAYDLAGDATASADLYNSVTKSFTPTGSMIDARSFHTATLLSTGDVLVTGGINYGTYLSSAELYNPSAGTFSLTTGAMNTPRVDDTATLLSSGEVLIAGGLNSGGALNSAELYDPATETFTSTTGSMTDTRYGHVAALLKNGEVLIAGGSDASGPVATAELYDPATQTFTATGLMSDSRMFATATVLSDGTVLIVGGQDAGGAVQPTADLYDPTTGTFSQVPSTMIDARLDQATVLLSNGKVLVAGGLPNNAIDALASADVYTPRTQMFSPTRHSMNEARAEAAAALLSNGSVLIAGGTNGYAPSQSAEVYNSKRQMFTCVGGAGSTSGCAASMSSKRWGPTATVLP